MTRSSTSTLSSGAKLNELSHETSRRLDLASLLSDERPSTELGRETLRGWCAQLEGGDAKLRSTAAALAENYTESELNRIRRRLERVVYPKEAVGALSERRALTTIELFSLGELARHLELLRGRMGLGRLLPALTGSWGSPLWPEGLISGPFKLDDKLSEQLGAARAEFAALRAERDRAREAALLEVGAAYGVQVPASGLFELIEPQRQEQAAADGRLELESRTISGTIWAIIEPDDPALTESHNRLIHEEASLLDALSRQLSQSSEQLRAAIDSLTHLDLALFAGRLIKRWSGSWAGESEALEIVDGWLPDSAKLVEREGGEWRRQSVSLARGLTTLTGANMGGKSTTLRLAGVIAALTKLGLPVPATEARSPVFNELLLLSPRPDAPDAGLSRFANEVRALAETLSAPTGSLLLLDEPASGTSPAESSALVCSTAELLTERASVSVLATHVQAIDSVSGARHLHLRGLQGADLDKLRREAEKLGWAAALRRSISYELREGAATGSRDALTIARLAGLPQELIDRAIKRLEGAAKNGHIAAVKGD